MYVNCFLSKFLRFVLSSMNTAQKKQIQNEIDLKQKIFFYAIKKSSKTEIFIDLIWKKIRSSFYSRKKKLPKKNLRISFQAHYPTCYEFLQYMVINIRKTSPILLVSAVAVLSRYKLNSFIVFIVI